LLACLMSIAAASMAQSARAQDAPAATAAPSSAASAAADAKAAPQQVIVTANRRREPAREVPMQVNSISTAALEKSGAHDLSEYVADQSGVEVKTTGGAGQGAINIRGVSTGDQTIATVAVYIDDVAFGSSSAFALGSTTALDMGLLDLNHIELLKGPQGTLYGASSMGGLLKYVTNEPDTGELSGKVTLGASATRFGGPGYTVSGVVNVPIKEDVAGLRVSAFRDHTGGYVDAVGPAAGKDINRGDTTGGRVSLLVEPSTRFKVRMTATAQDIERDGLDSVDYDLATGKPAEGDLQRKLWVREPYSLKVGVGSLDLEYTVSGVRLNSITSVQSFKLSTVGDLSGAYVPVLAAAFGIDADSVPATQDVQLHKQTQEFRLTSTERGTFEWLGGLFFDHETTGNQEAINAELTGGGAPLLLGSESLPSSYREAAVYGDLTWNATPRLALTAGARLARNQQVYNQIGDGPLAGGPSAIRGTSHEIAKTWLATARYALTPESNVYLRAASGYRPGGPNAVTPGADAPTTFKHDDLWSYEAGYKADLLDKRLAIEASAFEIHWNDIQGLDNIGGITVAVNEGRARIHGLELDLRYVPDAAWNMSGNLSWLDGKTRDDIPNLAAAGERLPNSPEFAAALAFSRTFEIDGHPAYAGFKERYVGASNAGFAASQTLPAYTLPAYFLTDLQTGITWGRYDVSAYVRNVFDKRGLASAGTGLTGLGAPVAGVPVRPRTIGASMSVAF
jgi:outer membrane receptor protein involved in Fe transport